MNKICILGSINMDMVVSINKMPLIGETIFSDNFKLAHGGKGANQAVAAQRLGSEVHMISKVGQDAYGLQIVNSLEKENINVDNIFRDDVSPTGTAIITVDNEGNNSIIVVPGANMTLNLKEINKCKEVITCSDIIVSQFETPIEVTIEAFKFAKENEVITILNPAPAKDIPKELLKYTDIIVPNETEATTLTGINVKDLESAKQAANIFFNNNVKYVIITLGDKGAAVISKEDGILIPAYKVNAIDTTAAGDSFIGAVSTKLTKSNLNINSLAEAVKFANKVSAIAVQREGAQPSIPSLKEINEIYGEE
ncbi:ribokinase [Clostridium beijerinckii]|uniref:Ribokinase n=1 Tax=Clostridium beijerinckii TaxID=1520 RepID=A0A0B5QE24_CLOBE|nr:ribokinase [Clostridium beijerinckii]AJH00515.1 ribokinase [Clostridium beijerinckii]AQS06285.1 ribokinase [Clostridium beijerinckii]MBA2888329.1 ribokinase [Clostridium beijerinckii]MBA2903097.1 ribokinase [Clostridium beijerinckii]MBA2912941.1 ribokinase [Clostridium beijerinckii]